jgi:hypothetical protein
MQTIGEHFFHKSMFIKEKLVNKRDKENMEYSPTLKKMDRKWEESQRKCIAVKSKFLA